MAENDFAPELESEPLFKEAVCVDAMRIYDSCSDKDCLEDIRVFFPTNVQPLLDSCANVRIHDIDVITVYIDMQPIPINRGYYSVDLLFFFDVSLDIYTNAAGPGACCGADCIHGLSLFSKKVILYGSEGNVKMFSSDDDRTDVDPRSCYILPKASVQVAKPVALSAKICDASCCPCEVCSVIPESIASYFGAPIDVSTQGTSVYVTIGLFSIVQIVRNVQILIPAYDFCIPDKECVTSTDNPCELFRKIDFPTEEFFPPKAPDGNCGCAERS